jgi:hypothetical protein
MPLPFDEPRQPRNWTKIALCVLLLIGAAVVLRIVTQ